MNANGAIRAASLTLTLSLALTAAAAAQNSRGYLGAAVTLTPQGAHTVGSAPSLPRSGASGTALGIAAEIGGHLTPSTTVGVEIDWPSRFVAVQQTDYFRSFQYESRHRDLAILGIFRAYLNSNTRVRVALVGGGGPVQESTKQRRRDQVSPFTIAPVQFGPWNELDDATRWTVGATGGVDVEFAIGRGVSIVPQARAVWINRSADPGQPVWFLGLDQWVIKPAIGVRARF